MLPCQSGTAKETTLNELKIPSVRHLQEFRIGPADSIEIIGDVVFKPLLSKIVFESIENLLGLS